MTAKPIEDTEQNVQGNHACLRCAKTGKFITYVENNIPKGPGGICFRCEGKGYHTQADRKRNHHHDEHDAGGLERMFYSGPYPEMTS